MERASKSVFWPAIASFCLAFGVQSQAPAADTAVTPADLLRKIKVPAQFEATVFAAPPEVGYPTCLTAAPTGELYVGVDENGSLDAKAGRGRVLRCIDTDGDGHVDKINTFATMDSPRGVWFEHNTLYVMHPPSVTAYIDDNGDGVADRSEELVKGLGFDLKFRGADHTVNGMRMGIDGWLYIAVGDYGAIHAEGKDGTTLQLHGGGIVRVRPDGSGLELVTHGQRNIYDVAVSPLLDLFTRDNTNDGDGWNVRLSHIIHGGNYGYPSLFMSFGDEIVQPLADYGGGSPCGSLYMDEPGFPAGFGTTLYTCEWGRSIVYRHPLEHSGAGFKAEQEVFVEIPRPTDMDVDGQGRIYISSWDNGGFNYSGPNVGFVARVTAKDSKPQAFPDLAHASSADLLRHLGSPSAVCRLFTQREILRRGSGAEFNTGLAKLADSDAPLAVRVAAIFTLEQLDGAKSHPTLVKLAARDGLREYALRALTDDKRTLSDVPVQLFADGLKDSNPRVQLQAVIGLERLGHQETAPALLQATADSDPLVSHLAINALVSMRASDVCLQALKPSADSKLAPGAARVLQALHESSVADGLIATLATPLPSTSRQAVLKALCRLYQREADWDGKWWGTRPDTSGPYFKPVKWEGSDRIAAALRQELGAVSGEQLRWFAVELQKNKVDLPELSGIVLGLASKDPSFRPIALNLLAVHPSDLDDQGIVLLKETATAKDESPANRSKAIRTLQRSHKSGPALEAAIAGLVSLGANPRGDLAGTWEEFARDVQNGRNLARFQQLTESSDAQERLLGLAVLVNLANNKVASAETKAAANRSVDAAWNKPDAVVALLNAITRVRAEQYALQIRSYLTDARPEVKAAAERAADRLRLNRTRPQSSNQPLIETMSFDDLVALASKEKGTVEAGERIFTRAGCVACHTITASEPPKGPFLGDITTRYSRAELCESILKPNAKVAQGFETQWIKTKGDDEYEGFVTREGGDDLDIRNTSGITTLVLKKDIAQRGKRETSMMPTGLLDKFTANDLVSLLAYLESLKPKSAQ